jgi:hypothetical protein
MFTHILEHDNFWSHIILTGMTEFHISGCVSRYKCAILDSEPLTEHLEHGQDSPKLNVWSVLTCARVIGPFFFDENIIPRHGRTCSSTAQLQMNNAPVHVAHIVHDWCEFHRSVDWKKREVHGTLVLMILCLWTFIFEATWKVRCTVTEWIFWMSSSYGSLQQLQMLQRTCYSVSGSRWDVCKATDGAHFEVFCT